MALIVGIDPGKDGAAALYGTIKREVLQVWDFPKLSVSKGKGTSTIPDWEAFKALLAQVRIYGPDLMVIERVHAMPKQGVSSSFSFGETFGGQCQLARHLVGCPVEFAEPGVWKRAMKVKAAKDDGLRRVRELFPSCGIEWKTVRGRLLDGRVDAALIAAYGQQLLEAGENERQEHANRAACHQNV